MGKRVQPVIAPTRLARRVREMVFRYGVAATSDRLGGIAREQVLCIAGQLPTTPGPIAIAEHHIGSNEAA